MDLVRVASECHLCVAKHALQTDSYHVGRLLRTGLCLLLDLGVLVNVRHGGYRVSACSSPVEGAHSRRSGRRFRGEGRSPRMQPTKRRPRGAGTPGNPGTTGTTGTTNEPRSGLCLGRAFGAGRSWFGVEENGLGRGVGVVLGDDDPTVSGELEIDLRQGPIMGAPQGEGRAVQRIWLAVGVVEGVCIGIEQVSRVRLFRGRI